MCFVPQVMLSQDCCHGSTAFTPTVANIGIKGIANELGDKEEEVSCLFVHGCRQGGGGLKPPQISSPCYYVYKQLLQKDMSVILRNFLNTQEQPLL